MPTDIDRVRVQKLVQAGALLVEVLPAKEYEEEHLPGAINLPLKKLTRQSTSQLQLDRPIIVYYFDYQ